MNRVTRFVLVALVLLLSVSAVACSRPAESETQPTSFLWQVSAKGNRAYILGSIHMAKADLYPLNEAIQKAYDQAKYLVVEADITEISEEESTALLFRIGAYQSGDDLQNNIPPDLYSRLTDRLKAFDPTGNLITAMNAFEPWVVGLSVAVLDLMWLGYSAENGIDYYFLTNAHADGKKVLELESAEFQLDLMDGLSEALQVAMLRDAVENPVTDEEIGALVQAWKTGDSARMEEIIFEGVEENPDYKALNEKIIDGRNILMAEKIEGYLQSKDVHLVVVGAGHLVGDNGILKLLTKKGYLVKQL